MVDGKQTVLRIGFSPSLFTGSQKIYSSYRNPSVSCPLIFTPVIYRFQLTIFVTISMSDATPFT